jgi:hypothetical protein
MKFTVKYWILYTLSYIRKKAPAQARAIKTFLGKLTKPFCADQPYFHQAFLQDSQLRFLKLRIAVR